MLTPVVPDETGALNILLVQYVLFFQGSAGTMWKFRNKEVSVLYKGRLDFIQYK